MIVIGNSRALTQEIFEERFHVARPEIELISGKYETQKSRFRVRHPECGYEWETSANNLMQPGGCPMCNGSVRLTNDVFLNRLSKITDTIIPLEKYHTSIEPILCHCTVCNQDFMQQPHLLLEGCGCPICRGYRVAIGYNDFNHVYPDLVKYLANKEDGLKVTKASHKQLLCRCPDCGYEKYVDAWNLSQQGFGCPNCGDGVSYPNKFIRAMLDQLNVDFEPEYHEKWCKSYFYDCYFELNDNKYVIEMDGNFHYSDHQFEGRSLEKTLETDRIKDELADKNGVIMIRIDSRESDADYISNSIKNSLLSELFDLSLIDWEECDKTAMKNLVKECCLFYEQHKYEMPFKEIAKTMHVGKLTLYKYILKGNKHGWCNSTKEERKRISDSFREYPTSIPVRIKRGIETLGEFKSLSKAVQFLHSLDYKITHNTIKKSIENNDGIWNDLIFEYI